MSWFLSSATDRALLCFVAGRRPYAQSGKEFSRRIRRRRSSIEYATMSQQRQSDYFPRRESLDPTSVGRDHDGIPSCTAKNAVYSPRSCRATQVRSPHRPGGSPDRADSRRGFLLLLADPWLGGPDPSLPWGRAAGAEAARSGGTGVAGSKAAYPG